MEARNQDGKHNMPTNKRSRSDETSAVDDDGRNPSSMPKKRQKLTSDSSSVIKSEGTDSFPGFVDPSQQRKLSALNDNKNKNNKKKPPRRRGRGRNKNRNNSHHDSKQTHVSAGEQEAAANAIASAVAKLPPMPANTPISTRLSPNDFPECQQTLRWYTAHEHVPIQGEWSVLPSLIRYNETERGMMRDAGDRYKEIVSRCKPNGMQLSQALSLRRLYMRHLYPDIPMAALGLGKDMYIRHSATLFESSVQTYMKKCNVQFVTEQQQRSALPKGQKSPPTPDFILSKATRLSCTIHPQQQQQSSSSSSRQEQFVIHWVEAKMFYGASSIARGSDSAVGYILSTAEKYVNLYGTGAMVFMYGCGRELAQWLRDLGVVALDAHPLDLSKVERHQRKWCGNENGMILP